MIDSLEIKNYRCFQKLRLGRLGRLNVLVGDNGTGKTTLLEALLLALTSQTEAGPRIRQHRGFEGNFQGTSQTIERALWADFFHNSDMSKVISINLSGESPFDRELVISRGSPEKLLTFDDKLKISEPVVFTWRLAGGGPLSVSPTIGSQGMRLPSAFEQENISYFFPSTLAPSQQETATRFSELSQADNHRDFVHLFRQEYSWISDISVEVIAGTPVLFASTKGNKVKIPLPNLSGGLNRMISILLAIYESKNSVILIDEIENGQYFKHFEGIWRLLIRFMRYSESQLFITSHSGECLQALSSTLRATRHRVPVNLHQFRRFDGEYEVETFEGADFLNAFDYGEEIR